MGTRMGSAKYQRDGDPRTSGPGFGLTTHPDTLDQPLRWTRPRKVFVNSMSDLFHQDVPVDFIADVFAVMILAKQHTFQVLTKRPQRMAAVLADDWLDRLDEAMRRRGERIVAAHLPVSQWPPRNIWLGTSIESDRYAFRADHLRNTPAAVRFLSCEPLLGPLPSLDLTGIDWVIVGGESGRGARPMEPNWVRDLRDRSVAAGVAFHFKQWGNFFPVKDEGDGFILKNVGKHAAGRELDGRTWDEWPSNPAPESVMAVRASDEQVAREGTDGQVT